MTVTCTSGLAEPSAVRLSPRTRASVAHDPLDEVEEQLVPRFPHVDGGPSYQQLHAALVTRRLADVV